MTRTLVTTFILDVIERATKTAAQSALAVYTVDSVVSSANLAHMGQVAGGAAMASVLFSLGSGFVGNKDSASLVTQPPLPEPAHSASSPASTAVPASEILAAAEQIFPAATSS